MKYVILASEDIERLQHKVNEHLATGWELHGGLVASISDFDGPIWAREMIKNEITVPASVCVKSD